MQENEFNLAFEGGKNVSEWDTWINYCYDKW